MNKTRLKVFALIVCIIFSVGVLPACQGPSTTESKTPPPSNTTAPSRDKNDRNQPWSTNIQIAIALHTGAGARCETRLTGSGCP